MPHDSVTRTETEMNKGWAEANPELFVRSVFDFQANTPVTHWRHFVDLGRPGYVTLIAVRRDKPFADRSAYLADGARDGLTFLKETGRG